MKILIQNIRSRQFRRLNRWVADPTEATSFENTEQALASVAPEHVKDIQLLHFNGSQLDITIPVLIRQRSRPATRSEQRLVL